MPKLAGAPAVDDAGPVERVARIADVIRGAGDRNEKLRRLAPEVVDALHEQRQKSWRDWEPVLAYARSAGFRAASSASARHGPSCPRRV